MPKNPKPDPAATVPPPLAGWRCNCCLLVTPRPGHPGRCVRCGYFEHEGLRELPPAAKPDEPWRPPRYLRDAKGRPRAVPARGLQVLCCGWCKTPLVRADYFWVCPNGFHGKAQTDAGLLAALLAVWKLPLGQKQLDAPRRVLRNVYQLPALQRQQEG